MPSLSTSVPSRAIVPAVDGPALERPRGMSATVRPPLMVAVSFLEYATLEQRFGRAAMRDLGLRLAGAIADRLPGAALVGEHDDRVLLSVPHAGRAVEQRLGRVRAAVGSLTFPLDPDVQATRDGHSTDHVRLSPILGYTVLRGVDPAEAQRRVEVALSAALHHLDLVPVPWSAQLEQEFSPWHRRPALTGGPWNWRTAFRTPSQVLGTYAAGLGVPYLGYVLAHRLGAGHLVSGIAYAMVLVALVFTALTIYVESLQALDPVRPPEAADVAEPPASAIIAAYLPNEAATIRDTLDCFLARADDYPAGLQVVLAYNTPDRLPVEDELAALAARDSRLLVLRVEGSTSKAQNVNAALEVVTGDIVGIFDADHHPAPGAFSRAWRWLSNGYDVVQGHCVVRNGAASWVSRAVAVEFESIYAVSHPGRAKMHDFGIFGGSNGYWRTALLRDVRMRGSMLTEDIDSSMRVTLRGHRIANDPGLISSELAPTTLRTLAGQRLRWAQGWFQVSLEYGRTAARSERLSVRQKAGTVFLLGWREAYPWVSLQIFPLMAYAVLHPHQEHAHWLLPFFLFTSLLTVAVSSVQAAFAYVLGAPDIRRHRRWYLSYALLTGPLYSEFKNAIARVSQLKQLLGERHWRVTTRSATDESSPSVARRDRAA